MALEIRHGFNNGHLVRPFSFNEVALHLLTLSVQAAMYLHSARRTSRPMLNLAWRILGGIALVTGTVLILFNPAFTGARVNPLSLASAYLVPAALAVLARRTVTDRPTRRVLGAYALAAGFAWITLQIRQSFHPAGMSVIFGSIDDAELWAWSGAWLAYGIALMAFGIRSGSRSLRLAALGVVGLRVLQGVSRSTWPTSIGRAVARGVVPGSRVGADRAWRGAPAVRIAGEAGVTASLHAAKPPDSGAEALSDDPAGVRDHLLAGSERFG